MIALRDTGRFRQPHRERIKHYDELDRLTVQERPEKEVFRFWQEGSGYDSNLQSERAVCASIDYIHMNLVRRKSCRTPADWR